MSCSSCGTGGCGTSGGCDDRKATQRALFDDILGRIYPDRTWGRLDDEARFGAGVPRREVRRLGRSLAEVLKAPTFFRAGGDDDLCDFVYVLCVGRAPALVEVRDGIASLDDPEAAIEERYLRVAVSSVARVATAQELTMRLEGGSGSPSVIEAPRPGIFDPVLLQRTRKMVALLEASGIAHLDFGLLDKPGADYGGLPGGYDERYGESPRLWSFLFQAAPPTAVVTTALPEPAVPALGRGISRQAASS